MEDLQPASNLDKEAGRASIERAIKVVSLITMDRIHLITRTIQPTFSAPVAVFQQPEEVAPQLRTF